MDTNNFELKVQAVLDKVKSLANFRRNLKEMEPKLPKLRIQGTLSTTSTRRELNSKLKAIKPKVKVDADTTQAEKKIKKIGKQKTDATITPTVDTSQVEAGLKKAQKETKSLWERITSNIFGSNLIRMATQKVIQAVNEAFRSLKELDTIKTNIQMVSGTTNSGVNSMMQSYNAMAKELSSTTKEVGEAANEFLRMGESVASTNELIKNATILSKVGMIDSADAASYLISSMKGYQVVADDSLDIVNKLTAVDLEAAVSAGGLAEALSRCSKIANSSGTSMNRLIGYAASIGEVTQESMSVVGNSLKSMYSRMNNIKIGRFLDDETGESLSDTEAVLNKLGIKLRDTQDTYRDFDDVLDDVGKNWKNFTQLEKNSISVAIAGTMQRERFTALMNNYSSALEYSEVAANSAGSALNRYGVYQDSIEAKTNKLTAAIESLSTNTVSEELYSGIIEATTGLVEFIDKTSLLKGTLAGLITMGVSKAIVSIGTGFTTAAKSTAQLTEAMALLKNEKSEQNLLDIGAACKGLSDKQLKLILSTKGLVNGDREKILAGMDAAEAEQQQTLATLGFAAAEDKAIGSTFSLGSAFRVFGRAMAANPIGAAATAVSAAVMIFSIYKQHQEEIRQATEEAANVYRESASSIEDYASRYRELRQALMDAKGSEEETYGVKRQLLELQTELNDKFGDEYGAVNLVTDAYRDQTDVIKALNKETAQTFLNENKSGIDRAVEEMTKDDRHYILSLTGISAYTDKGAALKEAVEKYEGQGMYLMDELGDGSHAQFSIHLKADAQGAYDTINAFETDLRNKARELGDEHMFDDVLDMSSVSLNSAKETIDRYRDIYMQGLTAEIASDDSRAKAYNEALEAVESYNDAVLKSVNPYDDQEVAEAKEALDAIKSSMQGNEAEWGEYSVLLDDVFGQADTRLIEFNDALRGNSGLQALAEDLEGLSYLDLQALDENVGENSSFDRLKEAALGYKVEVDELIAALVRLGYVQGEVKGLPQDGGQAVSLSISSTVDQLNTQLKPTFDSLKSAYNDIFTDDGSFALDSIDILSTCDSIKSKLDGMKELGLKVDYSSYEDFVRVLQNSESKEHDVKDAFDSLASSITSAGVSGAEDFETLKSALEDLGVVNDELVAFEALISNAEALTEALAEAGIDLAGATEEQITAFANERVSAENASQAVAMLTFQKELYNMQLMNTAGEVANLKTLAENAGYTGEVIKYLTELEQIYQEVVSGTIDPLNIGFKIARAIMLQALIKESAGKINYESKVDFNNAGGGSKSASKAGKEAADKYLEAFQEELKDLDDLKDCGKITEKQYLDALRRLYLKYFRDKEKYLKEYEKYEKQYLDGMKSLYESAFSYITKQIDRRIDTINDQKDAVVSALEAERDASLEEIELKKEQLENEQEIIDRKIKGKQEAIDAIEKEIDAMQEANKERKREIDLQKAKYDFERMLNQRTSFLYKGGQMVWQADTSGIRDAKQGVEDAQLEVEIGNKEKKISLINEEIEKLEKEKDLLQERINLLDKEADNINKHYDDLIAKEEQRYDAMVKGLEDYKSQFEELTELLENAQMEATLMELGVNMDALLSGSQEEFEKLKTAYIGILADMSRGNDEVIGQLSRLAGVNAESVSYLESTKGAFDSLGAVTLEGLSNSVSDVKDSAAGLATSAGEASNAIGGIQESVSGASQSIAPLNTELEKLKKLTDEVVTLLGSIKFPEIGDEGYVQKLRETAAAFGDIALKCAGFSQIDFSAVIGAATPMENGEGNAMPEGETAPAGTGFMGLASAISDAVTTIQGQMDTLRQALDIGNTSFDDQIKKITEEYLPAWEELQARLAEIIGVSGSDGDDSGKKVGNRKPVRNSGGSESGGNGGSIIDIMQTGGEEVASRLDDPWLKAFNDFATDGDNSIQSICRKIVDMVREMGDSIQEQCAAAANALRALSETIETSEMPSIGVSVSGSTVSGNAVPVHAKGTVGKAYAKGTGGYKGLPHDEKNALRSEYGQPELTVYPDGKAELTTEPTMGNLPKGTVIFNEEQTSDIIKRKGEVVRTYENGNVKLSDGTIVRPNGEVLRPLTPNDSTYQMIEKFKEYFNENRDAFVKPANAMNNAAEAMQTVVETINNNNTMNRNEVNIGDIHLHEVQDVHHLSQELLLRFPNMLLQEKKRL